RPLAVLWKQLRLGEVALKVPESIDRLIRDERIVDTRMSVQGLPISNIDPLALIDRGESFSGDLLSEPQLGSGSADRERGRYTARRRLGRPGKGAEAGELVFHGKVVAELGDVCVD